MASIETAPKAMLEEQLPFSLRLVRNQSDLDKAIHLRHSAYARHLPGLAETLKEPEPVDFEDGVVIFLAESKLDGSPLGTMRIQTNDSKPLCLEESVDLPNWLRTCRLAEAQRLAVTNDKTARLVKAGLFKAYFVYCRQIGIEWLVIAGRSPIDRAYERMLFKDVFPEMAYIPLRHAGNLPHRIMCFHLARAEEQEGLAGHPMFDFFFRESAWRPLAHKVSENQAVVKASPGRHQPPDAPPITGLLLRRWNSGPGRSAERAQQPAAEARSTTRLRADQAAAELGVEWV